MATRPASQSKKTRARKPLVNHNVPFPVLNGMIENCVGGIAIPVGIAEHFTINGNAVRVPMATEERTVIAAASKGAKLAKPRGFNVLTSPPVISAQISYANLPDPVETLKKLNADRDSLDATAQLMYRELAHDNSAYAKLLPPRFEPLLRGDRGERADTLIVVELEVGSGNSMGAGLATLLAQRFAELTLPFYVDGTKPLGVVPSNRKAGVHVRAEALFKVPGGEAIRNRILDLHTWAQGDATRAVTHNKGIMNGISAVALATGQDTRAIEAAAHLQAAQLPRGYGPLTSYTACGDDGIIALLELTLPFGTRGGATGHPAAIKCRGIMGKRTARDLAGVAVAVGLAQNFAALNCLANEGLVEAQRRVRKAMPLADSGAKKGKKK